MYLIGRSLPECRRWSRTLLPISVQILLINECLNYHNGKRYGAFSAQLSAPHEPRLAFAVCDLRSSSRDSQRRGAGRHPVFFWRISILRVLTAILHSGEGFVSGGKISVPVANTSTTNAAAIFPSGVFMFSPSSQPCDSRVVVCRHPIAIQFNPCGS